MNKAMKNLKSKKLIVSLVLGAVCILILVFAYNKRVDSKVHKIKIPYAKVEIKTRTKITDDMIDFVEVAGSMVSDDVITQKNLIVDKYVNYNTTIPEGSLFYSSSVVDWSRMPDSAWSDIEDGNTVVSLSVAGYVMVKSAIYPGSNIDLYYQTYDESKLVYGKLIENIRVLAVKDRNGNHIFKRTANEAEASDIIFSVPEELHLLLRKASYLSGKIVPVLRNSNYTEDTEHATIVSSEYLRELILEQTVDIPEDQVQNDVDDITINSNTNTNTNNNTEKKN